MAELIPYGVAHTLYFPLVASGTQALSTAASGSLSGTNIIYSIDGGAWASSTATGTAIPGSGWYRVVLDASETTGSQIMVKIGGGTLGTIVEVQNFLFKTFGNANAFYPSNVLGTALSAQTVGTVSAVLTGTISTVTGTPLVTVTGTPAVDVVLWKGTAAAGTQGTPRAVVTGGTADANLVSILGTAAIATQGTLTNIGTAGTALGTITASGTVTASTLLAAGTPAVNLVSILGTAAVATQGTLTNIGTAGLVLAGTVGTVTGTPSVSVVAWLGTGVPGTQGTPQVRVPLLEAARSTLTGVPTASAAPLAQLDWMYAVSRGVVTQDATTQSVYNLNNTLIATAAVSGDTATFTRGSFA